MRHRRCTTSALKLIVRKVRTIPQRHYCGVSPILMFLESVVPKHQNNCSRRCFSVTKLLSKPDSEKNDKNHVHQQMDCFGEPITFLESSQFSTSEESKIDAAIDALDTFTMTFLSRGKTAADGGMDEGIAAKAAHSSAIFWADLIRNIQTWCHPAYQKGKDDSAPTMQIVCDAPMLVAAAFSPLLAQAGSAYVQNLNDSYFSSSSSNFQNKLNLMRVIKAASSLRHSPHLSKRERFQLLALHYLMNDDHQRALATLNDLLNSCPGDAFGLSLAIDIANVLGDRRSAFRAASSVAAYWNEREKVTLTGQPTTLGHSIGCSLIAVGFAVGGRYQEAEQLAERAKRLDSYNSTGLVAWVLAHVYEAEGRVSEGASLLFGFDGVQSYADCGFLFFDSILGGYGGLFVLDRDGARADQMSLGIYDENFGRVLEYSGYNERGGNPILKYAPMKLREVLTQSVTHTASSVWEQMFRSAKGVENKLSTSASNPDIESSDQPSNRSTTIILEDILSWMPPTPHLLMEGTFLLLRLTMNGTISEADERWQDLRVAWEKMLNIEKKYAGCKNKILFTGFSPLARIACSVVLENPFSDRKEENTTSSKLEKAANMMAKKMQLGKEKVENSEIEAIEGWKEIGTLLSEARSGWSNCPQDIGCTRYLIEPIIRDFDGLNLNFHSFSEYAICHSALKSEDSDLLCIARSICSENVVMRLNSPEIWWRYSLVLEKLGDNIAAEDARATSISLGSGEGAKVSGVR